MIATLRAERIRTLGEVRVSLGGGEAVEFDLDDGGSGQLFVRRSPERLGYYRIGYLWPPGCRRRGPSRPLPLPQPRRFGCLSPRVRPARTPLRCPPSSEDYPEASLTPTGLRARLTTPRSGSSPYGKRLRPGL